MSKHTPGPWTHEGYGGITGTENGRKYNVACVYLRIPAGRQEANARLIAAAPDLLDALEGIIGYFDSENSVSVSQATIKASSDEIKAARAAIAKATGGAA